MSEKIKKILALLLLTDGTGTETGKSQKKMSLTRQSQLIARMTQRYIFQLSLIFPECFCQPCIFKIIIGKCGGPNKPNRHRRETIIVEQYLIRSFKLC